ncbi:hypothetical protein SAMN02910384_01154 [Pseudobutyrivibrio sp. ACV-2]|uniref:hypothetical protein n=1 Tax=Pseudobutyrivibrio sp. ACV-2 TaxID=1520801 RepID=UPI00089A583E|nr:hypothetical protein [Pseudobutyrivibrio sp. ACV-2]SEA27028.1 hypothetical protein SAMN02910384_01154 [Pseudobutyrivibrio sp. ACV-2]
MSRINLFTVMLVFMQAMNLMTLFISVPDFSVSQNIIKFFWPGGLALIAFIFGQLTKPRA